MKKILLILLIFIFQFSIFNLSAQQPEIDTVWVEGRVIEVATGQPQPNCEVQFLQEGEAKAVAFCDEEGYFSIGWMPTGLYTLSVLHDGNALYYSEFQLTQSAMVNIALMPDTVDLHALRPAEVTASRHKLGEKLITSPDDSRLWNFNGIWELMDAGPASADLSGGFAHPRGNGMGMMLLTPPIWILCNEPWNPTPKVVKEEAEEPSKEEKNGQKKEKKQHADI